MRKLLLPLLAIAAVDCYAANPSESLPTEPPPVLAPGGGFSCDPGPVFEANRCTSCHSPSTRAANLDLTPAAAELATRLLDVRAGASLCAERRIIDSRDPELSVLLTAVDAERRARVGACALSMPPDGAVISADQVACVASFVREAAARGPAAPPFEPASAESALNKVKMLASGAPVTAAELEAVRKDTSAVRTLVERWATEPAFEGKVKAFLSTALQQAAIGDLREGLGFPKSHFTASPELREALESSFVRTAWDIIESRRPFTEIATTKRWSLTTAELVLLSFAEQTESDLAAMHEVKLVPPSTGPITVTRVGTHWEIGGVADSDAGCRVHPGKLAPGASQTMNASELLRTLFGRVQCRGLSDVKKSASPVSSKGGVNDFSDARFIRLSHDPTAGMPPLPFMDVNALRTLAAEATFTVRTPRAGFLSTPVFFDNWQTNVDNQHRVTVNQALTVALGATFSAGDTTPQSLLSGIDSAHAATNTPCYDCHRLMDPMRPFFSNSFDTDYRRRALTTGTSDASFAFLGHTVRGQSLDDFAVALTTHPRFATAWVLKVCGWANSRACSDGEPEVARLAQVFQASRFDFRQLVIEVLSSPLVTSLSGTTLSVANDVSLVRRQHLCAALASRLGNVVDGLAPCASAKGSALARLIPDDAFARGKVDFVQTSMPGTFYSAAVEQLCARIAPAVVTAKFPSSNAPEVITSLTALVETLVGLPVGHPRHDPLLAALTEHYQALSTQGAQPSEAMESAFVAACTSPDFGGMGL